jgi:dTDP-4-dehydrorhamnose reductase
MSEFVILGANGVLGSSLFKYLIADKHDVFRFTRENLDISDSESIRSVLRQHENATILNCIAFMPADKCEKDPLLSKLANVDFVENLADNVEKNSHQRLIHFSSDFVFDGAQTKPYTVNDIPNPINVYGQHKFESELLVDSILEERGRVVRFASLVGKSESEKTFIEKIIAKAISGNTISVVSDLTISIATTDLISKVVTRAFACESKIIHAVHKGKTTWYELARTSLQIMNIPGECGKANQSDYPTVAKRPSYSVLQPNLESMGIPEIDWEIGLRQFLESEYAGI